MAKVADAQENRRGSHRRGSYTARLKLKVLDVFDEVNADITITRKMEAFHADTRAAGTPYTTVRAHWASPEDRAKISRAAGKEYASSLLRIDREPGIRKMGKYGQMEIELYQRFKERRAHGRKVSGRWLTAMARQLVRVTHPESEFKGGKSWRRRFCLRKRIRLRRKTNAKNKTWSDSEPVLVRYLQTLRRRLQLDAPEEQQEGLQDSLDEGEEPEPEDVDPGREPEQGDDNLIDSSDDEDPNDILVTLTAATPTGYQVGPTPDAEQLEYKHSRGEELIDKLILFNWTAVGWCAGTIQNTNTDGRKKIKGGAGESKPANFFVYYEHDELGALHCLRLEEHNAGDANDFGRWVLLEKMAEES